MRNLRVKLAIGVAALGVVVITAAAVAGDRGKIRTSLSGFEEVPAILTTGEGTFKARLSRSAQEIRYELRYSGLEGGSTPTQAHIHIGQESVNGGISAWLCGSPTNPGPAGTPACLAQPATITGTITPANVVGPDNQGVAPNEFAELVRALREGVAYANVHTTKYGGGEIRGQIGDRDRDHGDDD
jgi:CHRD domain